ncbi:MAG: endonuclease/exonuclease/phosphatase family protein, partial [Gordonia sp. (in: high G+C Gram-positive bacteria)]
DHPDDGEVIGAVLIQVPQWVSATTPAGRPFTVVTANLYFGHADVTALAALAADAEVLSLQEVTPDALARIRASPIARRLPYEYAVPADGAGGAVIRGRAPFTDQHLVPNTTFAHVAATTAVPGVAAVRVIAAHPVAPLGHRGRMWGADLRALRTYLASVPPGPVIVAGDFNATTDHAQYRALLGNGFADAGEQSGAGFVPTFPTNRLGGRPIVALDHVVSRGFVAARLRTVTLPGSDHRAVVVSLVAS